MFIFQNVKVSFGIGIGFKNLEYIHISNYLVYTSLASLALLISSVQLL